MTFIVIYSTTEMDLQSILFTNDIYLSLHLYGYSVTVVDELVSLVFMQFVLICLHFIYVLYSHLCLYVRVHKLYLSLSIKVLYL